jgi:anion-transporting  ArsA/GET3 family ATPase
VAGPGLLDRRLVFVTGKGGVGKTTVAAGLGLLAARSGRRTLVCEVDATGALGAAFECGPLRYTARPVTDRLWAMAMDTEDSLREYLKLQLRVPFVARLGPLARAFDFVASAAPGVREILTIGKLCWEVRERRYDLVVVDAAASGHIVGQLSAPRAIAGLVSVGPVRDQTRWMLDLLEDPATTGLAIVTTCAEMPVAETLELADRVRVETAVELAAVVVNRVLPELFGRDEERVFDGLRSPAARSVLRDVLGPGSDDLLDAAGFAVGTRRARAVHASTLLAGLPVGVPTLFVPELFARLDGLRRSALVADRLAEEL